MATLVSEREEVLVTLDMLTLRVGSKAGAGFLIFARIGMMLTGLWRAANLRQHDCKNIVAAAMARE